LITAPGPAWRRSGPLSRRCKFVQLMGSASCLRLGFLRTSLPLTSSNKGLGLLLARPHLTDHETLTLSPAQSALPSCRCPKRPESGSQAFLVIWVLHRVTAQPEARGGGQLLLVGEVGRVGPSHAVERTRSPRTLSVNKHALRCCRALWPGALASSSGQDRYRGSRGRVG
jgi:hypothetical protein